MANVVEIIFDQFLEIVEGLSKHACFKFDECAFRYRVREAVQHRLLDVLYVARDKCGRERDVIATIDITGICFDYITTCKWIQYLEKIAREFIHDICPPKFAVVKDSGNRCREEPPRCDLLPCRHITTVINKKKPRHKEPEPEIIIEKECECVPECKREPCIPARTIIIREELEKEHKCGDSTVLVREHKPKHDWGYFKGNVDHNDHKWNGCNSCKPRCSGLTNNGFQHDHENNNSHSH